MPIKDRTDDLNTHIIEVSTHNMEVEIRGRIINILRNENIFLLLFLNEVEILYSMLEVLEDQLKDLSRKQSTSLKFYGYENSEDILRSCDDIKRNAASIMSKIKDLQIQVYDVDHHNIAAVEECVCFMQGIFNIIKWTNCIANIFPNHTSCSTLLLSTCLKMTALKKKMTDCVIDYQQLQINFKTKYRNRIQRQMEIAGVRLLPKDLNTDIFLSSNFPDFDISAKVLQDIKARHKQLKHIKEKLENLRNLFLDLSLIVKSECQLLSRVDYLIEFTCYKISSGRRNMELCKRKNNLNKKGKIKQLLVYLAISLLLMVIVIVFINIFK